MLTVPTIMTSVMVANIHIAKACQRYFLGFLLLASYPASSAASEMFAFSDFPAFRTFTGETNQPDFAYASAHYSHFEAPIKEQLREAPSFAGEFSIVQIGCGTGCSNVAVVNHRTGEVFGFPRGGEYNQGLEVQYNIDSRLVLVRWFTDSLWENCILESLVFDEGRWVAKSAIASRLPVGAGRCEGDIENEIEASLQ